LSIDEGPHRNPLGWIFINSHPTNMQISSSIGGAAEIYEDRSSGLSQDPGGLGSDERRRCIDQREKKADGKFGKVSRMAIARRRLGGMSYFIVANKIVFKIYILVTDFI